VVSALGDAVTDGLLATASSYRTKCSKMSTADDSGERVIYHTDTHVSLSRGGSVSAGCLSEKTYARDLQEYP
jgi:hypothetical protein